MLVVFWIERYFYIILIARIHPTANFYTYEQAKNFLNPANAKSSSQESLKENCHTFIGMCSRFTWFNRQILNLCQDDIGVIHNPLKYLKRSVLPK